MTSETGFAAVEAKLAADVVAVEVDGSLREPQQGGDLLGTHALADAVGDLDFRRGEPE